MKVTTPEEFHAEAAERNRRAGQEFSAKLDASCLRVYSVLHGTRVNGPGLRSAVWLQGCTLHCPGCWNPQTWPVDAGRMVLPERLAFELIEEAHVGTDGIALSGGEPFDQPCPLGEFLAHLARVRPGWTVFAWTGYGLDELRLDPEKAAALAYVDMIVTGRFERDKALAPGVKPWCGSSNQEVHDLTQGRIRRQCGSGPEPVMEFHLGSDGGIVSTGFPVGVDLRRTNR